MSNFEFATATKIIFGKGSSLKIIDILKELGVTRVLLVCGSSPERFQNIINSLQVEIEIFRVLSEPNIETVIKGRDLARTSGAQAIIALGGGSVLDAGKAIAALVTNDGDPLDYMEVVGRGKTISKIPLPLIAVPTTAGTGSEVTKNAVVSDPLTKVKASIRSPLMFPSFAIIDPVLLIALPPAVIAATGMDALSQNIEPYLSKKSNSLTDALALQGIKYSASSLLQVYEGRGDELSRSNLALASLYGGLCLANSGLGAVHGFAAVIGGKYNAPHGAVCAILLAPVIRVNLKALQERQPGSDKIQRIKEISVLLTGNQNAEIGDCIVYIEELCTKLKIPKLSAYGIVKSDLTALCAQAKLASSMKANPIELTDSELIAILDYAI